MASRKKPSPQTGLRSVSTLSIERATPMMTLATDHKCWTAKNVATSLKGIRGSFVRVFPPADSTDDRVQEIAKHLRSEVCTVRLMPKPHESSAVTPATVIPVNVSSHRQVVDILVQEATTDDRGLLTAICNKAMDGAGL